jgi:hypothetical protein
MVRQTAADGGVRRGSGPRTESRARTRMTTGHAGVMATCPGRFGVAALWHQAPTLDVPAAWLQPVHGAPGGRGEHPARERAWRARPPWLQPAAWPGPADPWSPGPDVLKAVPAEVLLS